MGVIRREESREGKNQEKGEEEACLFLLVRYAESVCFVANFKEARCAVNDVWSQHIGLKLVDTLFVPGVEEAVRLPRAVATSAQWCATGAPAF